MSVASSNSLTQLRTELDAELTAGGTELARELLGALKVLDDNSGLRRSLTDPTQEPERRSSLVVSLFSGKVSDAALTVLQRLAGHRWSKERELSDALEQLAVTAAAAGAEQHGGLNGLNRLADQLLGFTHVVETSHEVQRALTDQQAPADARGTLAERLISTESTEEARVLVRQAVERPRGAKPVQLIRRFADTIADRQRRWIADVTVARPLDEAQQERLQRGLSASFNRELKLNIVVDPTLVGGIRVQVGDDVVDSSVATRLNDLHRKMAG